MACPHCGQPTRAQLPAKVRVSLFGPRLAGLIAYLTVGLRIPRRGVEQLLETVLGIEISLGSTQKLVEETSQALAATCQELERSRFSGGAHIRQREPYCWKCTSSRDQSSTLSSPASRRSFFYCDLLGWVRMRNQRARFAEAKSELAEQTLALPHSQRHAELLFHVRRQQLAIPQIGLQSEMLRRQPQSGTNQFELLIAQAAGAPRTLPFPKPRQPVGLETVNPILHRAPRIAQPPGHLRAGQSLRHQQHALEAMMVAGFLGPADLVFESEHDIGGVGNRQISHVSMRAQFRIMRNYL